jgi:hypothetical protein
MIDPPSLPRDVSSVSSATEKRLLFLTPQQIKWLFAYYFLLLLAAFTSSCAIFIPGPLSRFEFMELALIGSSSMACLGSSVYYSRKLYKSVLSGAVIAPVEGANLKSFATFMYFFARPIFSVVFSLLIVIGVKSGLVLSGAHQGQLTYGFVQLTMFLSFFVGFLSGRFIRHLETWGERMLERVASGTVK